MSSVVLIVEKSGVIKESSIKQFSEKELYKKAGFKSAEGFQCKHVFDVELSNEEISISVYGKTSGRAGQENKYDFPPPIDTTLFFGSCILVANVSEDGASCSSISVKKWELIYEALFGGFEDIGEEDSEDEEEEEEDELVPKTKDGYMKDGFVVEDDDDEDFEDEDEEAEEDSDSQTDEEFVKPISSKKTKESKLTKEPKKMEKTKKAKSTVFDKIETSVLQTESVENFLDCTSELVEEEYE